MKLLDEVIFEVDFEISIGKVKWFFPTSIMHEGFHTKLV
jgi:hypothetical protein